MMEKYAKKEIDEDFYLQRMGAISLKLARVAHKTDTVNAGTEAEAVLGLVEDAAEYSDSNDSLSKTRPQSEDSNSSSDTEQNVGAEALASVANHLMTKKVAKKPPSKKSKSNTDSNKSYKMFLLFS